jgi:hypothetical protein
MYKCTECPARYSHVPVQRSPSARSVREKSAAITLRIAMGVGRRFARSASDSTLRRKKKPAEGSSLAGNWIVSPAPEIYSVTNYTTNTFAATPTAYNRQNGRTCQRAYKRHRPAPGARGRSAPDRAGRNLPVVVFFAPVPFYRGANARHFHFLAAGIADIAHGLTRRASGLSFVPIQTTAFSNSAIRCIKQSSLG